MKKISTLFYGATAVSIALLAGVGFADASVNLDALNGTTGARSENITRVNADNSFWLDSINNMRARNNQNVTVDAGHNRLNENTTVLGQRIGDVNVDVAFSSPTIANDGINLTGINSAANGTVDFTGSNLITGANSENRNTVNADRTTRINLENNARINNDSNLRLNTGNNRISRNTTVGDVTSGDVTATVSYDNSGSANLMSGINLGDLSQGDVSATFSNDTTGFNSENRNTLNADSRTNIRVENNSTVTNRLNANVNTGSNDVNENTTVGDVTTGDINLSFSAIN